MQSITTRLLVADSQVSFGGVVEETLEHVSEIELAAYAKDATSALAEAARRVPHVALVDMDLVGGGSRVIEWLRTNVPQCRALALVEEPTEELVIDALAAGASGYLSRRCTEKQFVEAIQAARRGELVVPVTMVAQIMRSLTKVVHESIQGQGPAGAWQKRSVIALDDESIEPRPRRVSNRPGPG